MNGGMDEWKEGYIDKRMKGWMDGKMDNGGVFHSLAEACGRNRSTKKEGFDFDLENFVSPKRERVKVRREV